jgi:hypothetical protein
MIRLRTRLAAVLFVGMSWTADAQLPTIAGIVVDSANAPIADATVSVYGTLLSTPTDDEGRFVFRGLTRPVRIDVSKYGFETRSSQVRPGMIEVRITLRPVRLPIAETSTNRPAVQVRALPSRSLSVERTWSWLPPPRGGWPTNVSVDSASRSTMRWNPVSAERDRGQTLLQLGDSRSVTLEISNPRRSPARAVAPDSGIKYFTSIVSSSERGFNGTTRRGHLQGRSMLSQDVTPDIKLSSTVSYGHTEGHGQAPDAFGLLRAGLYGDPLTANSPTHGFRDGPPEMQRELRETSASNDRLLGSLSAQYNASPTRQHVVGLSLDRSSSDSNDVLHYSASRWWPYLSPQDRRGWANRQLVGTSYANFSYTFTLYGPFLGAPTSARLHADANWSSGTQVRIQAREFPSASVQTVSAAALQETTTDEFSIVQKSFALLVSPTWHDRLTIAATLRLDDIDYRARDTSLVLLPHLSVDWRFDDYVRWSRGFMRGGRLRASLASQRFDPGGLWWRMRAYQSLHGTTDQPLFAPIVLGDTAIRTAIKSEYEVGSDVQLLHDVELDATVFYNDTRGPSVLGATPPSTGFPGSAYVVGRFVTRGLELQVNAPLVSARSFTWSVNAGLSRTANVTKDLGGSLYVSVPGTPERLVLGYPQSALWSKRLVAATVDAGGRATDVLCEGSSGTAVPCAAAPLKFVGQAAPRRDFFLTNSISWHELHLIAMVDGATGSRQFNADRWKRCAVYRVCEENANPWTSDPLVVASAQHGSAMDLVEPFIESASVVHLRELSLTFNLRAFIPANPDFKPTISIIGRNLQRWTQYTGFDFPENQGGLLPATLTGIPQSALAQWQLRMNLRF